MNQSPKVPPRFVPTLTEVVPIEPVDEPAEAAKPSAGLDQALAQVERSFGQQTAVVEHAVPADPAVTPSAAATAPVVTAAAVAAPAVAAPLVSFHSPWLADGLYARGKPASIPHELPPLPASLPPQQPFADASAQLDAPQGLHVEQEAELQEIAAPQESSPLEHAQQSELAAELEQAVAEAVPTLGAGSHGDEKSSAALVDDSAHPSGQRGQAAAQPLPIDEEQLTRQLMAHVDQLLEQRIKEAVEAAVQEQTQLLVSRLREGVEAAVRASVHQAVEAAALTASTSSNKA